MVRGGEEGGSVGRHRKRAGTEEESEDKLELRREGS